MARTRNGRLAGALLGALALPVLIAIAAVVTLVLGAAAGWAGGWIFPQVFERLSKLVFDEVIPAWQIGAMLGFVAGFLRFGTSSRR